MPSFPARRIRERSSLCPASTWMAIILVFTCGCSKKLHCTEDRFGCECSLRTPTQQKEVPECEKTYDCCFEWSEKASFLDHSDRSSGCACFNLHGSETCASIEEHSYVAHDLEVKSRPKTCPPSLF